MSFRVERHFNLLILEEGEEYVADVAATMALVRRGQLAESKGRLRIGSRSLVFQPDEASASILKFPFRQMQSLGEVEQSSGGSFERFAVQCDQFVQVATKTGTETRIVSPFTILKAKIAVQFHVHYASAAEHFQIIKRLWEARSLSYSEADAVVKAVLSEVTAAVQFDRSRLGHRESSLLQAHMWVRRVKPLLHVRGMLQVSDEAIYFQPHPNFSSKPVKRVPLSDVLHVFRRVHGVQANALEIITVNGGCLYLCFECHWERDIIARILKERRGKGADSRASSSVSGSPGPLHDDAEEIMRDVRKMTALWQSGLLSNFHYLDFLNCAAGRSRNDFSQYPVFPWVLKDYASGGLSLDDPAAYRDLSKPVGALCEKRLDYFKERMRTMEEDEQFLYGTHYSTPAYVIYWLLRAMPERMLRMHGGHFDAPARLFKSVQESWKAVNESTASLMELIPEFFVLPASWLENTLGISTSEGPLADVLLPQWASSITDFVCQMRAALESELVSQHLPAWIDLIFGHRQAGEEALKADNLFHPVCYTGSVARAQPASVSDMPLHVLETQLQEFGRVPRQLFDEAHPPRLKSPRWAPSRLREDPVQSEAWYVAVRHISAGAVDEAGASVGAPTTAAAAQASGSAVRSGDGRATSGGSAPSSRGAATAVAPVSALRLLRPRAAVPFAASGSITGVAACASNAYSIGEDGCLRVHPSSSWRGAESGSAQPSAGRNFRISPMPLSALSVLRRDLLAIGGHDNAVTLYSAACGSALAKCQAHADTVTCLAACPRKGILVSGSRDQSVRTWAFTPSALKNETTFDDVEQPVVCAAAAENLILAGASDGQLVAWDLRSGQPALEREMGGPAVACALHRSERFAVALDGVGELRLWDLRRGCESLRLPVVARAGRGSLTSALCFLTDCADWAVVGGAGPDGRPVVTLWGVPDQRELRSWQLDGDAGYAPGGPEVRFLVPLSTSAGREAEEGAEDSGSDSAMFACASASGAVHVFGQEG